MQRGYNFAGLCWLLALLVSPLSAVAIAEEPVAASTPAAETDAAQLRARIEELKRRLNSVEGRVKDLEKYQFDANDLADILRQLRTKCGGDIVGCVLSRAANGVGKARSDDVGLPPEPGGSGGYVLLPHDRGELLWTRAQVEKAALPPAEQCSAIGEWLLGQPQRRKNAFFVRGLGGDAEALAVCDNVDGRWEVFDANDITSAYLIEDRNVRGR